MKRAGLMLVGLAVGALAVSVGFTAWQGARSLAGDPSVPTHEVRRGEFVRRVEAEGNLEAAQATGLGPPTRVRGQLRIAWLLPDGTEVEEGDVVIRFDPSEMEEKLTEGRSERATAVSRMEQKRIREESSSRNLERDAEIAGVELDYAREFQSKDPDIFSRIAIIESQIDQTLATQRKEHAENVRGIREELAQVELDLLSIERRKAELKIDEAEDGLQRLELRAPHAGIFTLKEMWGRVPEVGSVVWAGNTLAEIPRLDVMQARVYVLEADAGGLKEGLAATLVLDAHPEQEYQATVKHVDALAQPRNRQAPVQYFAVVLELPQSDASLMKPGQRVRATLVLDELSDVLTVPRHAVFDKDGRSVVYVRRGKRFEATAVRLGPAALGRQVVESGLEEGDRIALRDPHRSLDAPDAGGNGEGAPGSAAAGVSL